MKEYKPTSYTTQVPVEKTVLDIERLLQRAGASKIAKDYAADGRVIGFYFALLTRRGELTFRMPCEPEKVYPLLQGGKKWLNAQQRKRLTEQSERVAWRVLLTWTSAQISMIKVEQVTPEQAFFSYAYDPMTRETLFEKLERRNFLMLGAPKEEAEGEFIEVTQGG